MTLTPSSTHPATESSAAVGRLIARERVRAMESLAGAIAHEIRAAVLGVTSAAQLLRYSAPQDPVTEKSLGRILLESERLSALHEALSEYATEVPPRLSPRDPDEVWSEVVVSMRGALEANSVLLTHATSGSPAPCQIDADQIARAFERVVHYALGRVQPGSELDIVSSVDEGPTWFSTVSIAPTSAAVPRTGGAFERPAFLLALANRTFVAHGGEVIEHHADPSLLVSIRLPVTSSAE